MKKTNYTDRIFQMKQILNYLYRTLAAAVMWQPGCFLYNLVY